MRSGIDSNLPKWKVKDQCGQKNGPHATVFLINGDKFIGEWKDNLKHGKGSYIKAKDGSVYEGEWQHDQRSGYGTLAVPQNDEKDPKKNLKTKELRKLYAGEWYQNEFSGRGTYYFEDGTHYEGEWKSNKQNGWGTRYYADGSRYDGEWKNGKRHGQGVLLLPNHDKYEGMWMNDMKEGPGRFYYRSKNQVYQGEWALDIPKCGALSAVPFSKQVLQQSLNSGNYTASPLDLPYLELADPESVLHQEREELMNERFSRLKQESVWS